jgi:hypothetical protein
MLRFTEGSAKSFFYGPAHVRFDVLPEAGGDGAYTGAEPDVITHLRSILPAEWADLPCFSDTTSRP